MSRHDDLIARAAFLANIASSFRDQHNRIIETSIAARRAVLQGLGLSVETEAEARDMVAQLDARHARPLPPVWVTRAGDDTQLMLRGSFNLATWRITDESGRTQEGQVRTTPYPDGRASFVLPRQSAGYYDLVVESGAARAETHLIVAPDRCFQQPSLAAGKRGWGATTQVYGLRSPDDFGIGSYSEVAEAAEKAGGLGASFLGLSPVHALFESDWTKYSPYAPSSRLALNTMLIDPLAIPGFAGSAAARRLAATDYTALRQALNSSNLVDYRAAWALKRELFTLLWPDVRASLGDDFDAYRRMPAVERHATFEALSAHFDAQGLNWSGIWPQAFRDVKSAEVKTFQTGHSDAVAFHAWLQFVAENQLAAAGRAAQAGGMDIGLYRDLAVGADRAGSEAWSNPHHYSPLSVGAPPDPLGPMGQDWGLPPFNPFVLMDEGLAPFRQLVSANMRHSGAIRIDHAFQLQRLFVLPVGQPASMGAYIGYPLDALLAVLRIESHRAQCLVIAEDLGNAPQGFSDAIMQSGVLSYRLLSFERRDDGSFKAPADYPRDALAAITTHDLPTHLGWWNGLDVDLRECFGIYDPTQAAHERELRELDRGFLVEALEREHLDVPSTPGDAPTLDTVLRFLARSPSALTAVQFEDVLGEVQQANLPGPNVGHPNWRRRLSADVATLTRPGGALARAGVAFAEEGRDLHPDGSRLASPAPTATYRLQFHKGFTFDDAREIVDYLKQLGISHIYTSPIQTARPGSTHGYDIVDHSRLNPELGGMAAFLRFSDAVKKAGLGLVVDIVPNHMGVGGQDNRWWLSVLEWGTLSPQADTFDIDWGRLGANGKLVIPFLGKPYGEALENGELRLAFDPQDGSFGVWHFEHLFPICPLDYPTILQNALTAIDVSDRALADLAQASESLRALQRLVGTHEAGRITTRAAAIRRRIAAVAANSEGGRAAIAAAVERFNGTPGSTQSFGALDRLLDQQSYRLRHWTAASSDVNYRRFFDINALAGIRVEEPRVFAESHTLIFDLVAQGRIQGLRIDHIDGLADPAGYLESLQRAVGPGFYIVAEKILEPGEHLRRWPMAGTTGYDVLNMLDGVLINPAARPRVDAVWDAIAPAPYETMLLEAKRQILGGSFGSELEGLVSDLKRIADADRRTRDLTPAGLRRALAEIIAAFPVYRSYLGKGGLDEADRALIEGAIAEAQKDTILPDSGPHVFIGTMLTDTRPRAPDATTELRQRFRTRFQQLTGPIMAKSLEDTLFYRYGRFLALNEVGGDPIRFGLSADEFHAANAERARDWPNAMVTTATHDTKRGEDARARLIALTADPDAWEALVACWHREIEPLTSQVAGKAAPDAVDQWILVQSLVGSWPPEGLTTPAQTEAFRVRAQAFAQKALREAKRHTSWIKPNVAYEEAVTALIDRALAPGQPASQALAAVVQRLDRTGQINGLIRTVLKATVPGVPDTYQGTEFWDYSFVDPDNRRPVDYPARRAALSDVQTDLDLTDAGKDRVLRALLRDRLAAPDLYAAGSYEPIATGDSPVLAFERWRGEQGLFVAVRRWGSDEPLALPLRAGRWRNLLTGEALDSTGTVAAADLLASWPVVALRAM